MACGAGLVERGLWTQRLWSRACGYRACGHRACVENWTSFSEQMCCFHDTVVQNQAPHDSPAVPAVPAVPGKVVSGTAAPTPCPHTPGARITVV